MWTLGEFLGLPEVCAKVERIPRAGLPCHKGYNAGRTCFPDAVQIGGRQLHKNLAGHDSRTRGWISTDC